MRTKVPMVMLLIVGFVCGVLFVVSCGSGGGGGVAPANAQTTVDMTGVESRLDQLIAIDNQLLTVNSQLLSRAGGTVNSSNHAPVAVASQLSASVTAGNTAMLVGSGSTDADGDLLTYTWSFVDIPYGSTAKLNDAHVISPSFVADVAGAYVVRLTVSDGTATSTASTTITAMP